jgi:hypothetical protein
VWFYHASKYPPQGEAQPGEDGKKKGRTGALNRVTVAEPVRVITIDNEGERVGCVERAMSPFHG